MSVILACALLAAGRVEADDCDIRPILNKARGMAKSKQPEHALELLGRLDEATLADCYQRGLITLPDILVFYRERGDLYLQSKRTRRLEQAEADYERYLDVYLPEDGTAKTEDGSRALNKPLPEPLAEYPRFVLNAYGNVCLLRHRSADLLEKYFEIAGIVPDLFDRSSLQTWRDALFVPGATLDPTYVKRFCLTLHEKRTRINPSTRQTLRRQCPQS